MHVCMNMYVFSIYTYMYVTTGVPYSHILPSNVVTLYTKYPFTASAHPAEPKKKSEIAA